MRPRRPAEHLSWLWQAPGQRRISAALVLVNFVVFGIQWLRGGSTAVALDMGAMQGVHVHAGEYWRLMSACFLHGGLLHVVFNMFALYGFLGLVEEYAGSQIALCTYLLTGAAGFAMTGYFEPVTISLGASGAVYGAIGVTLCIYAKRYGGLAALFTHPACVSLIAQLLFWTWLNYTMNARGDGRVDMYAHAGGFVLGLVIGWALTDDGPASSRIAPVVAAAAAMLYVGFFPPRAPDEREIESALHFGVTYARGGAGLRASPARSRRMLNYACKHGQKDACEILAEPGLL